MNGEAWIEFPLIRSSPVTLNKSHNPVPQFPPQCSVSNYQAVGTISAPEQEFLVLFPCFYCKEDFIHMAELDCCCFTVFSIVLVTLPRQNQCLRSVAAAGETRTHREMQPPQLPARSRPPFQAPNPTVIPSLVLGSQSPLFPAKPCSPAKSCCSAICLFMNFLVDWMFVGSQ